jgi:hypothetical protein
MNLARLSSISPRNLHDPVDNDELVIGITQRVFVDCVFTLQDVS